MTAATCSSRSCAAPSTPTGCGCTRSRPPRAPAHLRGEPIKVVDSPDAEYWPVRLDGHQLTLHTDLEAPLGHVVRVDLDWAARGDVEFAEVVPETRATLSDVVAAGDGLLLGYLDDAQGTVVYVDADGAGGVDVDLPAGALVGLDGRQGRASDASRGEHADHALGVLPARTARPRRRSGRGRAAPAARGARRRGGLVHAAPAPGHQRRRDGRAVLPRRPRRRPRRAASDPAVRVRAGSRSPSVPTTGPVGAPGWPPAARSRSRTCAAVASTAPRGTNNGHLANKQNVFDDVIAVAEDLIASGVTSASRLAVHGRSNGGLLAAAALTQRPDLFAAALPTVGVLDLLRFHKFTIGAAWISDYGDPDTPEGFADALAYSPLHRVAPGTSYPATLISTADHDDRVVRLHSTSSPRRCRPPRTPTRRSCCAVELLGGPRRRQAAGQDRRRMDRPAGVRGAAHGPDAGSRHRQLSRAGPRWGG